MGERQRAWTEAQGKPDTFTDNKSISITNGDAFTYDQPVSIANSYTGAITDNYPVTDSLSDAYAVTESVADTNDVSITQSIAFAESFTDSFTITKPDN